jgi:hypothetical protein
MTVEEKLKAGQRKGGVPFANYCQKQKGGACQRRLSQSKEPEDSTPGAASN